MGELFWEEIERIGLIMGEAVERAFSACGIYWLKKKEYWRFALMH